MRTAAPAGSAIGGLRGGMSRLVGALVADLEHYGVEIRTETPVAALAVAGSDEERVWTVTLAPANADAGPGAPDAETIDGRFVIVATPGAQALGLLAPLGVEFAALAGLDWPEPTAVELATLVIDAPALDAHPRGTGVLVAAGTPGVTAKALTHVSAKWEWVAEAAGAGRHVIRLSYGRAGEVNPAAGLDDAELQALALRDASALLGVDLAVGAVRGFARTVWGDTLSPATIGAQARVVGVRDVVADTPGLEVTGAWLAGTGLASVIPDALGAASRTSHAALGI
jgi:oxygen-dependent protoporphyrinogen oxidase